MSRQVSFEMCDIRPSLVMLWPVCLTQENAEVVGTRPRGTWDACVSPRSAIVEGKQLPSFDLARSRVKRAIGI